MSIIDWALNALAAHPKLSHGIAMTTTGVSGAVQYVERKAGLPVDVVSFVGLCVGVVASIVVIYANVRRIMFESKQHKIDYEIKKVELARLRDIEERERAEREERIKSGMPLRRKDDRLD